MTLVYNSLPHHASVGGVFLLFILRYPANCVSLHPDNTKKENVYPQSPDGAPKGQKLLAQGIALWYYALCDSFALQGQKHYLVY